MKDRQLDVTDPKGAELTQEVFDYLKEAFAAIGLRLDLISFEDEPCSTYRITFQLNGDPLDEITDGDVSHPYVTFPRYAEKWLKV